MDVKETEELVARLLNGVKKAVKAKDLPDSELEGMALIGIVLLGGLFTDIKRIADAAEKIGDL